MSGKILIVEGEEALSTPLRPALEAHGFGVETLMEPRECVERVREVAERLTRGGQAAPPAREGVSLPRPGGRGSSGPAPRPSGGSWPLAVVLALAGAVAAGWFFLR